MNSLRVGNHKMKTLDQINLPGVKQPRGGKRTGAGRKKGSGKKEPTQAIRVPVALLPEIERLVGAHKAKLAGE